MIEFIQVIPADYTFMVGGNTYRFDTPSFFTDNPEVAEYLRSRDWAKEVVKSEPKKPKGKASNDQDEGGTNG
jgi:hypothetical protein